jgi:NADP-dependent 3-hydroxy acid dehydrogenase YdfG
LKSDAITKTVLITGATSGIGKATAKIFAKNGYRLIITGRREDRLTEHGKFLSNKYGVKVLTLCFDIRDRKAVENHLLSLPTKWNDIDVLVNNAGLAKGFDPINSGDIDHWETMIDTNLKGLLYVTRAISPGMVSSKKGHIINVCSTAGKECYPNGNVYSATKYGVDALTKSMRFDLHKHGIRVGQVAPGHVEETEFALVRFDGDSNKAQIYKDFVPLRSKDVAETIYFMVSRPPHVNIQDVLIMSTQQASATVVDRSGR